MGVVVYFEDCDGVVYGVGQDMVLACFAYGVLPHGAVPANGICKANDVSCNVCQPW